MVSTTVAKMNHHQSNLPRAKSSSTLRTISNPISTSDHLAVSRRDANQESIQRTPSVPLRSSSILSGPQANVANKASVLSRQPSRSFSSVASRAKVENTVGAHPKISRIASVSSILPHATVNTRLAKPTHRPLSSTAAFTDTSRPPPKTIPSSDQDPFVASGSAAAGMHKLSSTKSMLSLPKSSIATAPAPFAARRMVSVSTGLSSRSAKSHTIRRVPNLPSTYQTAKKIGEPEIERLSRSKAVSSVASRSRNPTADSQGTNPIVNIKELSPAQVSTRANMSISSFYPLDTQRRKAATNADVGGANQVERQSVMFDNRVAGSFLLSRILHLTGHI